MKKFLFLTALMAMATTAFGEPGIAPDTKDSATTNVEVRAQIVDDKFVITDIYGQPLLLDFGKIQKKATRAVTSVDYKISAKDVLTQGAKFKMTLGTGDAQTTTVTLKNTTTPASKTTLIPTLTLQESELIMAKGASTAVGTLGGQLDLNGQEDLGTYGGTTTLTATVAEILP